MRRARANRRGRSASLATLSAGVLSLAANTPSPASPTGGQVTAGNGQITQSGNQTTISQQSQNLAIDWQSFNIAANQGVTFNQPGATAIVLNQVLGQSATQIFGSLKANGQVFILNPNGVLFGRGAQVSVGGLVAGTLGLDVSDFLTGKYDLFGNSAATVTNAGTITTPRGGYIALLGAQVSNSGRLVAPLGNVSLAAGQQITLRLANGSLLGLTVTQGALDAVAANHGIIRADGGQVLLTAEAADSLAKAVVNNDGIIEAQTLDNHNGTIRLLADMASGTVDMTGTLDASATTSGAGGNVDIFGSQVTLSGNAQVNANGPQGGGTILIGGDFHGAVAGENATRTYIGTDVAIHADATENGDGGNVAVWSDQQTYMYGSISATGGAQGGNGGFVETSGHNYLDYRGTVDLLAAHGTTGTLLLDPYQVTIDDTPSAPLTPTGTNPVTYTSGATSDIASSTINSELASANVLIQTGTSQGSNGLGTIYVTATATPVSWTTANTLSLSAESDININAPISGLNGALEMVSAVGNINQTAAINVGSLAAVATTGTVTLTNSANTAGTLAGLAGATGGFQYTSQGSIQVGSVASVANSGSTTGVRSSGPVTLVSNTGSVSTSGATISGTALSINAQTGVGSQSTPLATSVTSLTVNNDSTGVGGNDIVIANTGHALTVNAVTQNSATDGGIYLGNQFGLTVSGAIADDSTSAGDNIGLVAGTGLSIGQPITANGNVGLKTNAGNISQTATPNTASITAQTLTASASAGSVTLTSTTNHVAALAGSSLSNFQFDNTTGTAFVAASAVGTGSITVPTLSGIASTNGTVTVITSAGDLDLNAPITAGANILLSTATGNFLNTVGSTGLTVGGGAGDRWLVYSQNPANDTPDSLSEAFQQYNTTFAAGPAAAGSGDGFLYSLAPTLNVTLAGTVTKTYNGLSNATLAQSNYDINGNLNGDIVTLSNTSAIYGTTVAPIRNVGTNELVNVSGLSIAGATSASGTVQVYGYQLGNSTASDTIGQINQATLTLNPVTATKVYDSTTTSTATVSKVGLQSGDSVSTLTESYNSPNVLGTNGSTLSVNSGYVVNDGNGGNNYNVVIGAPVAGTITAATLNLTAATDTKVYDTTTTAAGTVVGVSGLKGSDTISNTSESFASKNVLGTNGSSLVVNSGYVVNDGNNGNNYHVVTHNASGTITPAALTLTTVTDTKTYDGTTAAPGATVGVSGLLGSDTISSLAESFNSKNVAGTNGSTLSVASGYVISDGNNGHNYAVSSNTSLGTITPAALTIDAVTDTKTYDATTNAPGITVSVLGLQGTDTVTGLTESFGSKNVMGANGSTLSVNSGFAVNDGNAGNTYLVTVNSASGTINPATLTLNAVTDTKTYDATTTATGTTVGITGLQGADTIANVSESFDSKNVLGANGSTLSVNSGYAITDGNGGNNYTVVTNTAAGTINPAALALSAVTDAKTYDGTTGAGTTLPTVTGLKGSDTVTDLTESFASKNAFGTNNSTLAVNSGYVINDGNSGDNYAVTTNTAAGTINPAPLTVTASDLTKPFGAANPAFTATYSGLGAGDTASSLGGTLQFSTTATTLSPLGVYPIVPSGLSSSNYFIDFVDGVLTIVSNRGTLVTSPGGPYDAAVATTDSLLNGSTPPVGQPAGPWLTIRGSGLALPAGLSEAE
jgi:filamentous hemagglutinin family protein